MQINCAAILSDLDGTLIDSARCVDHAWETWAKLHNLDPEQIKVAAHGMRTADSLKFIAPHLHLPTEIKALEDLECGCVDGLVAINGAHELSAAIPQSAWAIVTSGSTRLANHRLAAVGLTRPKLLVTADDVTEGKPSPQCYLKGAAALGVAPAKCVVLEDSPNGIKAGKAAGAVVIAIGVSRGEHDIGAADYVVHDLSDIKVETTGDGNLTIRLRQGSSASNKQN
ncbi:MAG: HAD-IA family hydrolase [Candidatus Obscuribacterales bacterium]|nr:HAD-IA family hydrolase [Candidatus Obscuribacterales bacterium]